MGSQDPPKVLCGPQVKNVKGLREKEAKGEHPFFLGLIL